MAFSSKKQNVELFFNMCMTEYETSVKNVEMCKQKARDIFDLVTRQWDSPSDMQSCLGSYDKALTDLSHIADLLRKFNIQLELDTLLINPESLEEQFTYPEPELLSYGIGYESECVITYIKDAKNKLFYITEFGHSVNSDCIVNMQTYFQDSPAEYQDVPKDGEIFGLYLEGYMFRCVKENGNSDKFSNFEAYLIDVGEIVTISEHMQMYELPTAYREFPAQAVLCKLEQINDNSNANLIDYLSKSLYVKHKFRILDKDRSMLFVNLQADTNPFRNQSLCENDNETVTNENALQITNPFKRYFCIKTQLDRWQINFSDENNSNTNQKCVTIEKKLIINQYPLLFNKNSDSNNIEYDEELHNLNGHVNYFDQNPSNKIIENLCYSNEFDLNNIRSVLKHKSSKDTNEFNKMNGIGSKLIAGEKNNRNEESLNISYDSNNQQRAVLINKSPKQNDEYREINGINRVTENERNKYAERMNVSYKNEFDSNNFRPILGIKSPNNPKKNLTTMDQLTEEERAVLFEEPLNTSNAMKAVMGYYPKDDHRICQFFNAKTNSCFKGAHCKMEHVEKIKDGWTRDEAPTTVDIKNQIVYPDLGEFIRIIPTHIINVEHFFAQIIKHEARYEPTLKEMIYKMNSPEIVQKYGKLKTIPVQFELVVAMYTDGFWYRAKVLNVMDDETLKVFYLDYGNSNVVSIKNVRLWDNKFDYLPFQAIRCKITGVAEKRSCAVEASEQLRKMILNMTIKALVIDNIEQLDVKLWDASGNDIGMRLIAMGLAENKYGTAAFNTKQLIPA